jgi:D-alanyl-lipoteichoic acid acyltransferase DltB (MBOAT superfamily)
VFLVSGLWHGANWTYIIWGALHGFYQVFGMMTKNIRGKITGLVFKENSVFHKIIQMGITFSLVCFAWVFFRAKNVGEAFTIIERIFVHPGRLLFENETKIHVFYSFIAIFILLAVEVRREFARRNILILENMNRFLRYGVYSALIIVMLLMGVFDAGQFIYFQF